MQKPKSTAWVFTHDHVQDWAYRQTVFTKEECEKIIAMGESLIPEDATTIGSTKNENNLSVRDSKISWIFPTEENKWVFAKLTDSIVYLNDQYFKFDLFGLTEGLQFTKYEAPGGHYVAHIDKMTGGLMRKLSITLQLSDPNDYEGGEVDLIYSASPVTMSKDQGYLVTFPSYMLHQVKPVTKGTRYSLVCWVSGPAFK